MQSLRVGVPSDPRSEVGPVVEAPRGKLEWALTTLEDGEQWLVEPRLVADAPPGTPAGCGVPASASACGAGRAHLEEFFGPMLGIMHASLAGRSSCRTPSRTA
jgi:RHH-type proline utilization regulon transcriptional repressor/proline dehydrogenase/delta 1-pyrroline-5-carboxylate dehydrogenase